MGMEKGKPVKLTNLNVIGKCDATRREHKDIKKFGE
jgi:hypothetical protein